MSDIDCGIIACCCSCISMKTDFLGYELLSDNKLSGVIIMSQIFDCDVISFSEILSWVRDENDLYRLYPLMMIPDSVSWEKWLLWMLSIGLIMYHYGDKYYDTSIVHVSLTINTIWPSDIIWQHRSVSTLFQVMACCLTASSHYLKQCKTSPG